MIGCGHARPIPNFKVKTQLNEHKSINHTPTPTPTPTRMCIFGGGWDGGMLIVCLPYPAVSSYGV